MAGNPDRIGTASEREPWSRYVRSANRLSERGIDTLEAPRRADALAYSPSTFIYYWHPVL